MNRKDDVMSAPSSSPVNAQVDALLGADRPPRWWQRSTVWVGAAVLLAAGGGWWLWSGSQAQKATPVFVTEPLKRGDVTLTVSANGTLQPTRSVNIGSELSGTVRKVFVDVNDRVKAGQVLVELDSAKLTDQVTQSRAALASAQAAVSQAVAARKEAEATLARYEEVARLSGGKVPSATELDSARAAADKAMANERASEAAVTQARAALSTAETNLAKASIRSPINGVVLTRSVDPGNAVAASLQAVTLFSVAEDLTQLKLDVAVDEADVGAVGVGQKASFTVSAFPTRRYPATIERVAFGSTKTENVVTYTTTLSVDNSDMSLRPGMTASATIVATERKDVLLVPNTALRFTPAANGNGTQAQGSVLSKLMPRPPTAGAPKRATANNRVPGQRQIWVLQNGQPVQMAVKTGITDGRNTEVSGEGLAEGMDVIIDQKNAGAGR
jgi:HlyD family secretion protein